MKSEPAQLMLRASALMNLSPGMIFVGLYSPDTYTPVALADRDDVQIHPDKHENRWKKFALEIKPSEVRAIVSHIRTPFITMTKITIVDLPFLCLRSGTGCLTGSSNFNLNYDKETFRRLEEELFLLTNYHYTQDELLEGAHPLQLSAILKEDCLVIGLCRAGTSSLKLLREIVEQPPDQPSPASSASSVTGRLQRLSTNNQSYKIATDFDNDFDDVLKMEKDSVFEPAASDENALQVNSEVTGSSHKSVKVGFDTKGAAKSVFSFEDAEVDVAKVERRSTRRTKEERRRQQQNRETEFCEDWRTATVRSIEALKMIGPFSQEVIPDDDKSPLIEHLESNAEQTVMETTEKRRPVSASDNTQRKKSPGIRRQSRATMV